MKTKLARCATSLGGLARVFVLLPLISLGVYRSCIAQAPTALSEVVFEFTVYSPMAGHYTFTYSRWLKADGTYVTITDDVSDVEDDLGPLAPGSGNWTYLQDSPTTAQITFSDSSASPDSIVYALTFATSNSGFLNNVQGQLLASGTFKVRPSQFGVGPTNISTRTFLTLGASTIAGFVIGGAENRFVLFRAVGPGLSSFGVSNTATKMGVTVFNSAGQVGTSVDWSATSLTTSMYQNLFAIAGAFPLVPEQGDACLVIELPPGAYTALATSAAGGNALIEVYFLP